MNYNQEDIAAYLKDIRKYKLLTQKEEIELAKRIQLGDEKAEEELVLGNLRFVIKIAKQYQNLGISLPDLINEGNYGIIKAAKRFDVESGNKFISYAVWWVKQAIIQCINDNSRMIRLPVNVSNDILKLKKIIEDDSSHANMYPKTIFIDDYLSHSGQTEAFEEMSCMMDLPDNILINNETTLKDALEETMSSLDCRERYIINEYYLEEDENSKTLEHIGADLNLTKERVRQIRDRALRKIRNNSSSLFSFLE